MGQQSPTNNGKKKKGSWKFVEPTENFSKNIERMLDEAKTQWDPSGLKSASGAAANSQTDLRESNLISCIADTVAMIMSEDFNKHTVPLTQRGTRSLRSWYRQLRPLANALSHLSCPRGSRSGGSDEKTVRVAELRRRHNSLFLHIDSVRAFTGNLLPSAVPKFKNAASAMERLAPTCTCPDSKSKANWSKWQQADDLKPNLESLASTSKKLQRRYQAYINGEHYAEPKSLDISASIQSAPGPSLSSEGHKENIPDDWLAAADHQDALHGEGDGDTGKRGGDGHGNTDLKDEEGE